MNRLLTASLLIFCSTFIWGEDYSPNDYIEIFSKSSIIQKTDAIQTLEWAGLSDPKIYDLLEKDLLENYETAESAELIRALNWVARGLSFSGNEKYIPTLEAVAKKGVHRNLRKFGTVGLEDLQKYKVWNPVINPNHNNIAAGYPPNQVRFINMLKSDDYELIRLAAKRIQRDQLYDHQYLDVLASVIQNHYQKVDDKLSVDSVAWAVRALAGAADPKYKAMIEDIAANAENKNLRKYASKYLAYYN